MGIEIGIGGADVVNGFGGDGGRTEVGGGETF